jgi:uncharacterized protein (TIGR02301 family)
VLTWRRTLIAAALLALAVPAQAQSRRDDLVALSRVLGESQALREACEGRKDQQWRSRMMRMLALEGVEGAAASPYNAAFTAGYAAARQAHPECSPYSRRAELVAAERGEALAAALARPSLAAAPSDDIGAPPELR